MVSPRGVHHLNFARAFSSGQSCALLDLTTFRGAPTKRRRSELDGDMFDASGLFFPSSTVTGFVLNLSVPLSRPKSSKDTGAFIQVCARSEGFSGDRTQASRTLKQT